MLPQAWNGNTLTPFARKEPPLIYIVIPSDDYEIPEEALFQNVTWDFGAEKLFS